MDSDAGAAAMACDIAMQISRVAMKTDAAGQAFTSLFALSYRLLSNAAIRAEQEILHKISDFLHASDVMLDLCLR